MMDVTAIGGTISAFKNAADLVRKLGDRVPTEAREAIAQLNDSVLEMQGQLLAAQSRESELLARSRALEEQIAHARGWQVETARYVLRAVAGGVVRELDVADASGEPSHWLCANCFEEQRKAYLQRDPKVVDGVYLWKCPRCSTAVIVNEDSR